MENADRSKMLVYTTKEAIAEMAEPLENSGTKTDEALAKEFGKIISEKVSVPDMALCGRMLETGVLQETTVEARLQVAHAISTHEARPEVDYYVAADDIPGEDAGAGYVDEAMFASACFYKYFSIHWETLFGNLKGNKELGRAHGRGVYSRSRVGQSHWQAEQLRRAQSARWNSGRDQETRPSATQTPLPGPSTR